MEAGANLSGAPDFAPSQGKITSFGRKWPIGKILLVLQVGANMSGALNCTPPQVKAQKY
jgi:hypothetical protein